MGRVYCGIHNLICCWLCDRCGRCDSARGPLGPGDYCGDCSRKLRAEGYHYSKYSGDFVK